MIDGKKEYIGTTEAIQVAAKAGIKVTRPTIVAWAQKYDLGHQLGVGKWVIDKAKLEKFLEGDNGNK